MMEDCQQSNFNPLTMLMSLNDNNKWKEEVSNAIVYLIQVVEELRKENANLRRQLETQHPKICQHQESDEKLVFNAIHVKPRLIKGFDPLQPNRVKAIGSIVADISNGHGLNGCSLNQVVQPITTAVIRKLFDVVADQLTFTEDSIGKGRPARYVKLPTEFISQLSGKAIVDGFNPTHVQRSQLLPIARTMAGTVARNYFNNARSHRKKMNAQTNVDSSTIPSPEPQYHSTSDNTNSQTSNVLDLNQQTEHSNEITTDTSYVLLNM
ncbi:hypothetical protein M3Y94_01221900 [Aphelenchoides besseyi]|nr:hypothetical protein M3Y94_01221900 [Aphelenchoides besseyi]